MIEDFVKKAARLLGRDRVHVDKSDVWPFGRDASGTGHNLPGCVVFPDTTKQVAELVKLANQFDLPYVTRGSGTCLSGGPVPETNGLVISTARMDRILELDFGNECAWIEPGVINLDLSNAVDAKGWFYAPDPSSQQSCTIGGNVSENSGGPHCLSYGVTTQHILGMELVFPDGSVHVIGGKSESQPGIDLRGFVVGSEGTVGIVTKILVRLTLKPEEIQTLLLGFPGVRDGAQTVSDIVAAGILPAAMEMMDQGITRAVEEFVHCGYPVDAGAVLLIEIDGIANTLEGTAKRILKIARDNRACFEKTATDTDEQALLWKGRKNAFGAVARIKPHYYLHDCVIPRTRLADVLDEIAAISEKHEVTIVNVFHAGDGNLHPLILFDRNQSGEQEKVELAGGEIIEACVAAGGTLSGEHGIGLEKMRYMPLVFTSDTLHTMQRIKCVFNPEQRLNPGKVLPVRGGCAEFRQKTS